jgi:hypothetical protein
MLVTRHEMPGDRLCPDLSAFVIPPSLRFGAVLFWRARRSSLSAGGLHYGGQVGMSPASAWLYNSEVTVSFNFVASRKGELPNIREYSRLNWAALL